MASGRTCSRVRHSRTGLGSLLRPDPHPISQPILSSLPLTHFVSSQTGPPRHRILRLRRRLRQSGFQPPPRLLQHSGRGDPQTAPHVAARAARVQDGPARGPRARRLLGQAQEARQGALDRAHRAAAGHLAGAALRVPVRGPAVAHQAVRRARARGRVRGHPVPAVAAAAAHRGVVPEHGHAGPHRAVLRHGHLPAVPVRGDRVHGAARAVAVSEPVRGRGLLRQFPAGVGMAGGEILRLSWLVAVW